MPTRDESLIQSIDDCSDILHMLHSGSAHNNINTEDEFAVGPARPNAGGNRANGQDIGPPQRQRLWTNCKEKESCGLMIYLKQCWCPPWPSLNRNG